jgi:hypothetical protein
MSDGTFRGEDENAGANHPLLDLVAGLFLLAIGIWFAAMSVALPVPGNIVSAPGLLPFLIAGTLAIMAGLLAFSALRRFGTVRPYDFASALGRPESLRRVALVVTVGIYVAALDILSFETYVTISGLQFPVGSFEPITMLALTAMLRLFWTRRLFNCLLVAVIWTLVLSFSFRGLFHIPMPG